MQTANDTQGDCAGFLEWARHSIAPLSTVDRGADATDLAALGRMIGGAPIVALSEAVHGGAEPLQFRNRVFEYLIEQLGFTAIAIESGLVESRLVHDYVRGGPGDLSATLAVGITWTFDRLPQNRALIHWLREYNAGPQRTRKINFYGFDLPGSPGLGGATRGIETALLEALRYLSTVDTSASTALQRRLAPFIARIRFDLCRSVDVPGYDTLGESERDVLTATISDLITLFERQEAHYTALSTASDYRWAYRAAIGARQADAWLREIPIEWKPSSGSIRFGSEQTEFLAVANDVRDRAQADNLETILKEEGPAGKVLIYAHRYHLSTAPIRMSCTGSRQQEVLGTYLRRRLGKRLITVGNLICQGEVECSGRPHALEPAPPGSIDALASHLGVPLFLLDLRTAPPSVARWLEQQHTMGHGNDVLHLSLAQAFDVLFYVKTVTPAYHA